MEFITPVQAEDVWERSERNTGFDDLPEVKLFAAVMNRAIDDALGVATGVIPGEGENKKLFRKRVRSEARQWLLSDDFQELCDLLRVGPQFSDRVRRAVLTGERLNRPCFENSWHVTQGL